jgi:hypothetical protein
MVFVVTVFAGRKSGMCKAPGMAEADRSTAVGFDHIGRRFWLWIISGNVVGRLPCVWSPQPDPSITDDLYSSYSVQRQEARLWSNLFCSYLPLVCL